MSRFVQYLAWVLAFCAILILAGAPFWAWIGLTLIFGQAYTLQIMLIMLLGQDR